MTRRRSSTMTNVADKIGYLSPEDKPKERKRTRKPVKYPLPYMEVDGPGFKEPYTTEAEMKAIRYSVYQYAYRNKPQRFGTKAITDAEGKSFLYVWRIA